MREVRLDNEGRAEVDGRQVHYPGLPGALVHLPDPEDLTPTKGASKANWESHAIFRGATVDEIADLTKDELVDKYGD